MCCTPGRWRGQVMSQGRSGFPPPRFPLLPVWPGCEADRRIPSGTVFLPKALSGRRFHVRDGRSAIWLALKLARVGPGDEVLVPGLHCPTMIEPVAWVGATPVFYDVGPDTMVSPELMGSAGGQPKAVLLAHYFGWPQRRETFDWIRSLDHRPVLIEDCAHLICCSSELPYIGSEADFVCFSIRKFVPVLEGGLLIARESSRTELQGLRSSATIKGEVRAVYRILEAGALHREHGFLRRIFRWLAEVRGRRLTRTGGRHQHEASPDGRQEPPPLVRMTCTARLLGRWTGAGVSRRRRNWALYKEVFEQSGVDGEVGGWRPHGEPPDAPYVYPLRVPSAEAVYRRLRAAGVPVLRWDAMWPATPVARVPVATRLAREVLQLPCHQSLDDARVTWIAEQVVKEVRRVR